MNETGEQDPQPELLPAEAFSEYPPSASGCARHPLVTTVFATRCGGMEPRPTPADLASGLDRGADEALADIETIALRTWLAGASTEELVRVYTDAGYSMQALCAAIHKMGAEHAHDRFRVRTLNTHCEPEWIEHRNRKDPGAESHVRPHGSY